MRKIGGTDIAALLGIDKYRNARDVYERIVNNIEAPLKPVMTRGLAVEPRLRELYAASVGPLMPNRPKFLVDESVAFASASPDDFADGPEGKVLVEYKTQSVWASSQWGTPGTDEVPEKYLCQVTWAMRVCGCVAAHVFVGFGSDDEETGDFALTETRIYLVRLDEELAARLYRVGEHFWSQHVAQRVPPGQLPLQNKLRIRRLYAGNGKQRSSSGVGNRPPSERAGVGAPPAGD
jgi:putative phage-type endonuclease